MIHLQRLSAKDAPELFEAVARSRELHGPWITPPESVKALVEYLSQPPEVRVSYGIREDGGALAGVVNINSTIRGAFQNAFLGYYALSPFDGRGLMFAGCKEVIEAAFSVHELHRLEANIQPANVRSADLVRRLGFRLEGHSPRYLCVDGEWRDHDRYALTVEDWRAGLGAGAAGRRG